MLDKGSDIDDVLRFLRDRGRSKIENIAVVSKLPGIDLKSAKPLVHLSSVWADRREADEAFQDHVERTLREREQNNRPPS